MGEETELKFEVALQDLAKLRTVPALRRKPQKEEDLRSVYFDTPKHELAKNNVTLRVRHNGDKRFQTIKSAGSAFKRGEWEHEVKGKFPDLRKAHGTPLAPLVTQKLKRRLRPIFETQIHRIIVPVNRNGSHIQVALDAGRVRAGRRSTPIVEVELELKRGQASEVFDLARKLSQLVTAKLALKSKAERGYDLVNNKPSQAVFAEEILLQRGMRTADAFRTIGRSILRHIAANEVAVATADSEGIHQMRVGLRRLRAAISLFGPLLGDRQTKRLKSELRWLTGKLATARDLDVYLKSEIQPLRAAAPGKREMRQLEEVIASRRIAAFRKARAAVASQSYRSLLLDTLQWLEEGDWAKHSQRRGRRRIEEFAVDILSRRTKEVSKSAARLRKLDARRRHKLRIAVKKLRYAGDFFGYLFNERKARKRFSSFQLRLKDLQDHLGALNDITVHQKLAPKLTAKKPRTTVRQRAYAAALVYGHEQSAVERLLSAADKDARRFTKARAFWV
jgi:inorganic triphosphatase YgiF